MTTNTTTRTTKPNTYRAVCACGWKGVARRNPNDCNIGLQNHADRCPRLGEILPVERTLTENERIALNALTRERYWYWGCGWIISGRRTTERALDGLVSKGLVRVDENARYSPID